MEGAPCTLLRRSLYRRICIRHHLPASLARLFSFSSLRLARRFPFPFVARCDAGIAREFAPRMNDRRKGMKLFSAVPRVEIAGIGEKIA